MTLTDKCPTGYAIRDPDAANDCEEWSLLTPYQRSQIEYAHQQVAELTAALQAAQSSLPVTFYADRPLAERVKLMADGWRAAVNGCEEMRGQLQAAQRGCGGSDEGEGRGT